MIDLITAYLYFAMQGPQEFCLACVPFGLAGMFTGKLPPVRAYEQPKTRRKKRKGIKRKARTVAGKSEKTKVETKPKYTLPNYTPEQIARIEELFRRGRGY